MVSLDESRDWLIRNVDFIEIYHEQISRSLVQLSLDSSKYTSQPKGIVKPKPNQFVNYLRQSSENRTIDRLWDKEHKRESVLVNNWLM